MRREDEIKDENLQMLMDTLLESLGNKENFMPKSEDMAVTVEGKTPEELEEGLEVAKQVVDEVPMEEELEELPEDAEIVAEEDILEDDDEDLLPLESWDDEEEDPEEVKRLLAERLRR